jgi:hypothetical protein
MSPLFAISHLDCVARYYTQLFLFESSLSRSVSENGDSFKMVPGYSTPKAREQQNVSSLMLAWYAGVITVMPSSHTRFKAYEKYVFIPQLDLPVTIAAWLTFMVGFHLPSPTQEPGLELQTVSYFSLLPF